MENEDEYRVMRNAFNAMTTTSVALVNMEQAVPRYRSADVRLIVSALSRLRARMDPELTRWEQEQLEAVKGE